METNGPTFTVALAAVPGSDWDTALMTTVGGLGTSAGAIYVPIVPLTLPCAEIVPIVGLPPGIPLTCQTMAIAALPLTVAVKNPFCPMETLAEEGLMLIEAIGVGEGDPPQPEKDTISTAKQTVSVKRLRLVAAFESMYSFAIEESLDISAKKNQGS